MNIVTLGPHLSPELGPDIAYMYKLECCICLPASTICCLWICRVFH